MKQDCRRQLSPGGPVWKLGQGHDVGANVQDGAYCDVSGNRPSLVIFDCDGVLIDSEVIACRVDAECLTEIGFPTTAEFIQEHFIGVSSRAMFERLERDHGRKLPADFSTRLQTRLNAAFDDGLEAIAGVADMLPVLGVKTCVASSSQPERLRHTLGVTGLWSHFDPYVFSATMVRNGKPAPDLFLYAAEKMGARPQDCVVVEDSRAGVTAGRAAGMRVLGFTGGSHCAPDHGAKLREAGADAIFADMSTLLELLAA